MKLIDKIMGVWEDKRQPSTIHFPEMCKCPITDCEDRGKYTNCYRKDMMNDCYIYTRLKND